MDLNIAADIEVFTPDNEQYTKLSALCITAAGRSAFSFQVSAKHDAHVALMSTNDTTDSLYEIVIGGWGNSESCIRLGMQQPCKESHIGPVLNGDTYIQCTILGIMGKWNYFIGSVGYCKQKFVDGIFPLHTFPCQLSSCDDWIWFNWKLEIYKW